MCSMCSTKGSAEDVDVVVLQRNSTLRRLRSAVESTFFFNQTSNNKKKNKENSH